MPRISREVQITFTVSEVRAVYVLIRSFFDYYDDNCNSRTLRKWIGDIRPKTLESVQTKCWAEIKDAGYETFRGGVKR